MPGRKAKRKSLRTDFERETLPLGFGHEGMPDEAVQDETVRTETLLEFSGRSDFTQISRRQRSREPFFEISADAVLRALGDGRGARGDGKLEKKGPTNTGRKKQGQQQKWTLEELSRLFGSGKKNVRRLENTLDDLVARGQVIRLKGPAYALPQTLPQMSGVLSVQRQGMGFVRTQGGKQDIYVHQSQLNGAWDGDTVQVALLPGRSGKSDEGRVIRVLKRAVKELPVRMLPEMVKEDGLAKRLAKPLDSRLPGYVLVDCSGLPKLPRSGELILVELVPAISEGGPEEGAGGEAGDGVIRARATAYLGNDGNLALFERMVKANHGISMEFPREVLAEERNLPADPTPEDELAHAAGAGGALRRDLRSLGLVTIDGEDAKDFDDAIHVARHGAGYILHVGIADVAHYVRPGSALDLEARERGNSCYFPASVEPMLPKALSNGLCSLNPGRPRLAMVAEIPFSASGSPGRAEFYPALMESKARLTYEEVQAALDGKSRAQEKLNEHLDMLRVAGELAEKLIDKRRARGALAFELPEPRAVLDPDGTIDKLCFREHLFAHKLIEEFMIAANEAVARHLAGFAEQGLVFLYRSHAAPDSDKLAELYAWLGRSGYQIKKIQDPRPSDLQLLLDAAQGRPEEFVVNRLLLRSLMQARYSPAPEGHFGLASEAYCHFTSPIRRYADLTVHRALRWTLGLPEKLPVYAALAELADALNDCERKAVEAEREIYRICSSLFLAGREGEEFSGVVAGLNASGLFVELDSLPVEGFMRLEDLPGDYYLYVPEGQMLIGQRNGRLYRLGQPVRVNLKCADPIRQELLFVPAQGEEGAPAGSQEQILQENRGVHRKNRNMGKSGRGGRGKGVAKEDAFPGGRKRAKLPKGSVRVRSGRRGCCS